MSNLKFGIGVLGFYGIAVVKNTQCNENETDGFVFSQQLSSEYLTDLDARLEEEAHLMDFGDCTERSSKLPQNHTARAPTLVQQTENAVIDP